MLVICVVFSLHHRILTPKSSSESHTNLSHVEEAVKEMLRTEVFTPLQMKCLHIIKTIIQKNDEIEGRL